MRLKRIIYTFTPIVACIALLFLSSAASAQTMSNDDYILEQGNLNSFSGSATGPTQTITFSSQNFFAGEYSGENFTVNPGFTYSGSTGGSDTDTAGSTEFSFGLVNASVDFGKITPGEPIIRTTTMTIDTGDAPGFLILTSANNQLKNSTGATIPDTTCDQGNCTEATAAIWNSPLTYGFGYRCDDLQGSACISDFTNKLYFKPFPNTSTGDDTHAIMEYSGAFGNYSGQITYKVNIPGTQEAGIYQNTIQYIALPSL